MQKKQLVISLGGSLIYPKEIDIAFLKKFKKLIIEHIKKTGQQVILVTGGGRICRDYNNAARALYKRVPSAELDWLGIKCTKVNAELVRILFEDLAYFKVLDHPEKKYKTTKKVLVSGGAKPGQSSDAVAVELAHAYDADTIINLSNIMSVYNKDPKKYANVQKITKISWQEFRKIIGNTWDPGANLPFDPIASRLAQRYRMRVIIAAGKDLKNVKKILTGKAFVGTTISD